MQVTLNSGHPAALGSLHKQPLGTSDTYSAVWEMGTDS